MNAVVIDNKPRLKVQPGARAEEMVTAYRAADRNAAYRAADTVSRELATWDARSLSGDAALLPERLKLTSRSSDIIRNNGYANRVVQIRIDSIVGHHFKLSYKPNWAVLGIDGTSPAAKAFVRQVEAQWEAYAEDPECRIDAEGKRTFTQLVRGGVSQDTIYGEILSSVEWMRRAGLQTAFKVINPERLSNPDGQPDTMNLRAGVMQNNRGAAVAYYIRERHESDSRFAGLTFQQLFKWKPVRKRTPWGRLQMIHLFDSLGDGDGLTRGASKLAPVLERFAMLDKWQRVELQNALLNAMYAMVIESEFDSVTALEAIGADTDNNVMANWLAATGAYHKGANITFNGVKVPHLFPNEKLTFKRAEAPTNSEFEDRLLRYIAAGSSFTYEQLAANWSKTNYSSARAALGEAWRFFLGEAILHKRHASLMFSLVLEEMFSKELVAPPAGAPNFWDAKSAWCRCDWVGPGRSMIDGLKETKELVLKLEAGLITYEKACAQLGEDYREIFDQQVREVQERREAGLPPPSWMATQTLAPDPADEQPAVNDNAQTA